MPGRDENRVDVLVLEKLLVVGRGVLESKLPHGVPSGKARGRGDAMEEHIPVGLEVWQ